MLKNSQAQHPYYVHALCAEFSADRRAVKCKYNMFYRPIDFQINLAPISFVLRFIECSGTADQSLKRVKAGARPSQQLLSLSFVCCLRKQRRQ